MMNTRVLKAHVDAVEESLETALVALRATGDRRAFAETVALAAVTAADKKPSFAVIVTEGNRTLVFGPYKSMKAAQNAMTKGMVGTQRGGSGYITALIPAPKINPISSYDKEVFEMDWMNEDGD